MKKVLFVYVFKLIWKSIYDLEIFVKFIVDFN